eukprot:GFUD01010288.1.p1 GENE.GFUD01010288.1~~GFUD01010288.1.p1  ORF type:complete len:573 (+),score=99.99 GFUD01010288.1:78-1796(+)
MEEMEEIKFEELDEVLDDIEDLEEIQDVKDCSFSKFYAPIRSLFAADSQLLDKFSMCKDHMERLQLLVEMEVVKNSLADIKAEGEVINQDKLPEPSSSQPLEWKSPPKLSYGPNKTHPHLSKAIEVKSSKTEGRYMVAKQKILPGDVLMVDTSYATSLFEDYYKSHCNHCFIRIKEEPVNCPTCCKVKFCSTECMKTSYLNVHRWECPVLQYVDNNDIGRMATLAYRIVARTGYNYLSSQAEQFESMEPTYTENDYISVFKQEDNMGVRPIGDHLKRCVTGLILTRCLQISEWFPENLRNDLNSKEVLVIANIIVRHIQSCSCNAYEINEFIRKGSSMVECESVELGGAVYPTISLSNHACSANTSRTNFGTCGIVRAITTIYPNEKVYDNYGYFYHTEDREHRQNMLSCQYFFNCACAACKEDWPTYRDLARREPEFCCFACKHSLGSSLGKVKKCPRCKKDLKGIGKIERQIQGLHRDFRQIMDDIKESNAEANIKTYSLLLSDIEKVCKMPCKELITCQQVLLQCFAAVGNASHVEIAPELAQMVPYSGGGSDYGSSDEDDEGDMPGLI